MIFGANLPGWNLPFINYSCECLKILIESSVRLFCPNFFLFYSPNPTPHLDAITEWPLWLKQFLFETVRLGFNSHLEFIIKVLTIFLQFNLFKLLYVDGLIMFRCTQKGVRIYKWNPYEKLIITLNWVNLFKLNMNQNKTLYNLLEKRVWKLQTLPPLGTPMIQCKRDTTIQWISSTAILFMIESFPK